MRTNEASKFLLSFKNGRAREFVKRLMLHNYTDAVLEHYPNTVTKEHVYSKCKNLTDEIFAQIKNNIDEPENINALINRLSRVNPKPASFWFKEFNCAYENYKHTNKILFQLNHLKPFLKGNSFCDIGCGGGDLVYFIKIIILNLKNMLVLM